MNTILIYNGLAIKVSTVDYELIDIKFDQTGKLLEFGYKLINSDYYIHKSWDYEDYILILTYKKY